LLRALLAQAQEPETELMVIIDDLKKFFSALRFAARGPQAQGRILFLAYPALTPSARKRASGRTGLTCCRA